MQNALWVNPELWYLLVFNLSFSNITALKLGLVDQMCLENTTILLFRAFHPLYTITFLAAVAGISGDWWEQAQSVEKIVWTPVEMQGHSEQTLVSVVFSTLTNIYHLRMSSYRESSCGTLSRIRVMLNNLLLLAVLLLPHLWGRNVTVLNENYCSFPSSL